MTFCPECGAKLVTQKFCQECGANISKYLNNESTSSGLGGIDFSAFESEAQKQLAEQERLADFEIENGVLKKYIGKGGKVSVPETVKVIGPKAFAHDWSIREKITEVVFEGNVTEIGEKAFEGCYNMKSIKLPSTLRTIGNDAFLSTAISEIALPSRLEVIGTGAFSRSKLTSITIPGGVTLGGDSFWRSGIFGNCENLRSVTIDNGVTAIQSYMFDGCGALESVIIPNSVRSIGDGAFSGCVSLKSIAVPYGVETAGANLFRDCRSLTRVDLPGSIKKIESGAFSGCRSLSSITIPQSVTFIAEDSFTDCVALERIQYNAASVSMIGTGTRGSFSFSAYMGIKNDTSSNEVRYSGYENQAFENAGSERGGINVTFGSGVVRVPDGLFHTKNCKIASISFEGGSSCERIGAYAFYGCSMVRSIQIPSRVTEIGDYAFYCCSSITSLDLPSGVKKIGESAFSACESLMSITMPSYLTEIANNTFNGCKRLQGITIPYGVTRLGECAFLGCDSITSLEIPYSVKEIEHYAIKIRNRMTIKIPRDLSWHFFKEEYEFNRDDWKLITY